VDERFGIETVSDLIAELKKPGRDPRQKFEPVRFQEGINKPSDLEIGMELQGIVTNVTDFGAFVDIGVHQDGLVHLSEISHTFIKNPADALAVGQAVKVKVIAVDLQAKRIGLSIKALLEAPAARHGAPQPRPQAPRTEPRGPRPEHRGPRPGARAEHRPERKEGRPERRPEARTEARPKPEPKESPKGVSLDDLMARFNKGLR